MNRLLSLLNVLVLTAVISSFSSNGMAFSGGADADPQMRSLVDAFAHAMQGKDIEKLRTLYAPDAHFHDVNMRKRIDRSDALLEDFARFWSVHTAFDFRVEKEVLAPGRAALQVVWSGTIPAALVGKPEDCVYSISGVILLDIEDGRVARQTDFIDLRTYIELFGLPQK